MKKLLLQLSIWALRKALGVSANLWRDLRGLIRGLDANQDVTAEVKHHTADNWLVEALPASASLPNIRRRLIQAAVLSLRLESYLQ